jgi:hypothetical protein
MHQPGLLPHCRAQFRIVEIEPAPAPQAYCGRVDRDDLEIGAGELRRGDAQYSVVRSHQRVFTTGRRSWHKQRGFAPCQALLQRIGCHHQMIDA